MAFLQKNALIYFYVYITISCVGLQIVFSLIINGVWLSLVERMVRDHEAGGSNPLTPTKYKPLDSNGFKRFFVLFLLAVVDFVVN